MLTCKDFISELSDFLDETTQGEIRAKLERHIAECPNCWVICDTTKKTIKVYKGMRECEVPQDVHTRLMDAVEKKMQAKKNAHGNLPAEGFPSDEAPGSPSKI